MGFGVPSGPLETLQGEIALAGSWIGYGPGGTLVCVNTAGKGTLFGDIAGHLERQVAALLLLLKQGRHEEIGGLVVDAVKAATQGYYRAEHYGGLVWRGIWVGAGERRKTDGEDGSVRWVLDPLAHHCRECPIYGADPPGREYPHWQRCCASRGTRYRATGRSAMGSAGVIWRNAGRMAGGGGVK